MSEQTKLESDIVERINSALGLLDPSIKYGGTMTDLHLLRACKAEIERLRSPVPAEQWSPGVAKAMEVFEKGLAKRRIDELGLPWHVEPWGDGSKPPYVNICSNSHGAVIAADLDRDTANWICNMANLSVEKVE